MMVDVGCNGRISDGGVFSRSPIAQIIGSAQHGWPAPSPLRPQSRQPIPYYIIADDAFPLRPTIMKPFSRRQLTRGELIYNYRLSRARRTVENAFGLLASRFRVLQRAINLCPQKVDKIVLACCALHNYLRRHPTARATYSAPGSLDVEDLDSGVVNPGRWRQEGLWIDCDLIRQGSNNCTCEASEVRDRLHDYVNFEGKVPWQNRIVQ